MSSDYYFNKWEKTLSSLGSVIVLDLQYQETNAHDQQRCDAAQRLSGILARYMACYNDALDCQKQNIQVQKTVYMTEVVKAIVARIIELKKQLRKLEGAYYQFLSNGMIDHKLTPDDTEFADVYAKRVRSDDINDVIIKALQKAKEMKEETEDNKEEACLDMEDLEEDKWWEEIREAKIESRKKLDMTAIYQIEERISDETLRRKQTLALIQAHEKTRQVTQQYIRQKQRREKWANELRGILNLSATIEMKERGAKLIQKCLRHYFELKRKKVLDCKRDELLQLRLCNKPSPDASLTDKEMNAEQYKLCKQYENHRKIYCEDLERSYLEKKRDEIVEDFRDNIRDWFRSWYDVVKYFYDIPKEREGGSTLILKEEIPSPAQWREKYEVYLENKKANKNKTDLQMKFEKRAAKEEELMLKRQEFKKKKLEAELLRKIMKNPALHPGYTYPDSKKTAPLIQAIKNYNLHWHELDKDLGAKEKFVKYIDEENLCMGVKLEICKTVDVEMRQELKQLRKALKEDYKSNGEEMPATIKEKAKLIKKKRKRKVNMTENIFEKLTDLAVIEVLKEYPRREFLNFLGDPNFAGDSLRCILRPVLHFGAETRAVWWEMCGKVLHGSQRILLVGPIGSGKTTLVHIMASVNDAVLYELDLFKMVEVNITKEYLKGLVKSVTLCAKATQPSIIYIKHVHRCYYRKVPSDAIDDLNLMKRFLIRKLFKKIHHHDNVTIIGACFDPWLAKSQQLLKIFSTVLLLPHTSYSAVFMILKSNRMVPPDLDIHSLAHVLQGYSFGYLAKALDDFLTADRIIKISAYGLKPQTIYEYILSNDHETEVDYEKYRKWYSEKTRWGKIESNRQKQDQEFRVLVEEWREKMEKNKKKKVV